MRRESLPILTSVTFEDAVVVVQYVDPDDLKGNGAQKHTTVFIPREDEYDDEIADVEEKVHALLVDINEDWPNLKTVADMKRKPDEEDEDDD